MLDQIPQVKKNYLIREEVRLTENMRHQNNGISVFEVQKPLLDPLGRNRIERGSWFISQNNLRFDGKPARQAKSLLLSDRKP